MYEVPFPSSVEETMLDQAGELRLLIDLPSRPKAFFNNLRDLIFPTAQPQLDLRSAPAAFWPDVFVKRGLPWSRFLESGGYHVAALALLISFSRFLAMQPEPQPQAVFDRAQVIYYQ